MKVFNAIPKNGVLIKGEPHSSESFKKLDLWDFCFVDDDLHQVVTFDEKGNPLLTKDKTEFAILVDK